MSANLTAPSMRVRYSYLPQQFANPEPILEAIRQHLRGCQFTLGPEVETFEESFARLIGTREAIGVGSGTDALELSLRAAGVGHGDEVITAANTFIATVGAINGAGARAVLVDARPDFTIDPNLIERAITPRTKAIIPVHLTGETADMTAVLEIAARRGIAVIEDACQAIGAQDRGRTAGTMGLTGAFSLHPLKNLNVWGDAGIIVTNDAATARRLRLLRNHGLQTRDEVEILGFNCRLDSIQAIVGNWLLPQVHQITQARIDNAARYDAGFADVDGITLPPRRATSRRVYHLYQVYARDRDGLHRFLLERGIEAKIHYPIPLPLPPALRAAYGYKPGDFPETERQSASLITLPVDQHLSAEELDYVIAQVRSFYGRP
jgi:dTDP-4-amino-4,6-dideoxygalactose transaminase